MPDHTTGIGLFPTNARTESRGAHCGGHRQPQDPARRINRDLNIANLAGETADLHGRPVKTDLSRPVWINGFSLTQLFGTLYVETN